MHDACAVQAPWHQGTQIAGDRARVASAPPGLGKQRIAAVEGLLGEITIRAATWCMVSTATQIMQPPLLAGSGACGADGVLLIGRIGGWRIDGDDRQRRPVLAAFGSCRFRGFRCRDCLRVAIGLAGSPCGLSDLDGASTGQRGAAHMQPAPDVSLEFGPPGGALWLDSAAIAAQTWQSWQ